MNRVKRVVHATAAEVNGLSGKGVTAAVLDTGIALHPDLSGRIAGFADFVGGQKQPYDDSGHGTHVAGCLCGNGKCSNGLYAGIAPGCRLVVCKVLDERGDGNVAAMIEGIRYVLDTRRIYHTRILNISVGIGSIREAALEQELLSWIAKAWNAGLFVAVAAGNKGHKNACAAYSGRGPANGRVKKPDLVAPGSGIVSCNAWYRKKHFCSVNHPYTAKNGTSMAVPAVSAAAALLWEKEPHLTNEQVRERLLYHAQDLGENWGMQGWGMLHVGRALKG